MTNEELEKEYKRLKYQFFRLLACLYPHQIGERDIEYVISGENDGINYFSKEDMDNIRKAVEEENNGGQ